MSMPDVDKTRIYIFGISEGGYGSQRLASFYADYWAAAGPMAGGEIPSDAPAENCGHIGFSLRTGANDFMFARDLLTTRTHELFDSLQQCYPTEYRHHVELIPGRGHGIDYSPTTPWLSYFTRIVHPRHFVWEDFPMDGIYRRGFYNIAIHERDTIGGNERTRYEMTVRDNTIELTIVIPAEGPSLGTAPSGTCTWISFSANSSYVIPVSSGCALIYW